MVDRSKVESWIKDHIGSLKCPCCGNTPANPSPPMYGVQGFTTASTPFVSGGKGFALDETLAMTNTIDENGRINHLSGFPLVAITCQNCAYVLLFAAKQVGVIKDAK